MNRCIIIPGALDALGGPDVPVLAPSECDEDICTYIIVTFCKTTVKLKGCILWIKCCSSYVCTYVLHSS